MWRIIILPTMGQVDILEWGLGGADIGDGDDWMDSTFAGREAEFDSGRGYDLFDLKGAKPLMIQLLGWAGGHIVLSIQPYLSSDLIDGCGAPLTVIVLCHLICYMFKGGLHFILHLRHSLGEVKATLEHVADEMAQYY